MLEDYRRDMERCSRCSKCKWVPLTAVKSQRFSSVCPAIERNNFHSYSGGGKMTLGLSMLDGRTDYTDKTLDIIYSCTMCGACDISCKSQRDLEPLMVMRELRAKAVEDGQLIPEHTALINGMRNEDNPFGEPKAERGKWAENLDVKDVTTEEADVLFHAGCRYSYDEDLWETLRAAIALLKDAGVDIGIAGEEESCCGGRAADIGYIGELVNYADDMKSRVKSSGAEILVTPCSDCYSYFKQIYPMYGKNLDVEVLHITEYLEKLMKEGKIELSKEVPKSVTYHDPCHLGRLGESYKPWDGEEIKILNQVYTYEPPKSILRGEDGVYEPPRNLLKGIPKLELVEMERTREYSFCCGAGGGVKEAFPDLASWTAENRIEEAKATGAEAIATSCPWCIRNFRDAIEEYDEEIEIYDVIELVQKATGGV